MTNRRSFNDAFRRILRENRGESEPPPPTGAPAPIEPPAPAEGFHDENLPETPNESLRRLLRDSKKA